MEDTFFEKIEDKMPSFYFTIWRFFSDRIYRLRMFLQRVFRGYADEEIWSLYDYTARYVLPKLKLLKETKTGCPCVLDEMDEQTKERLKKLSETSDENFEIQLACWDEILDKMIWSFTYIVEDRECEWVRYIDKDGNKLTFDELPSMISVPRDYKDGKVFTYTMIYPNNEKFKTDVSEQVKMDKRYEEGMMLFGKYFRSLWD